MEDEAAAAQLLAGLSGGGAPAPGAALLAAHPELATASARPFPMVPCAALRSLSQVWPRRCISLGPLWAEIDSPSAS